MKPRVKTQHPDEVVHRYELAVAINGLLGGGTDNTGTVTLAANAATTTIHDSRIGPLSVVFLMPTTANAAAALPGVYIACAKTTATLTHANNTQTDRTYQYAVFG